MIAPHRPRTLRGRLVALLAVILTIGFATAALVTVLVLRHVLTDRLDAQLRAAGDRFAVGLEHDDHDADNPAGGYGSVQGQPEGTLGARVLAGVVTNSAIVGRDNATDELSAAARARLARLTVSSAPRSIDLPGAGRYRVIVTAGRDDDLQITGLPAAPVEATIDHLVLVEVVVFGVTLLLVAVASTGLVRVMLRPLARMAGTAAEVSGLPLGSGGVSVPHRVPVDAHGSEVDTLGRAFNTMLEQVESALHTRDAGEDRLRRFVADASHELRTPVAVIRAHAELALRPDGTAGTLPDPVVHSLERITAQAQRMGHLVEDLLLLARLDSGRELLRGPVDVARLTLDALDDVRATAADHQWRLAMPSRSVWVAGDAHSLSQAVANVLANAATHTPAGTTVSVVVDEVAVDEVMVDEVVVDEVAHGNGAAVRIVVADDGPGMSAELAARAFDRFVHSDHGGGLRRGSSGLGLPIVAAVVAALDGTVTLDSGPAGTSVCITLPGTGNDATDATDADASSGPTGR